tara:strand:- start:1030 stop:1455 length:426 start_codon:yes stop_codon:yes gene_type:complete
MYSTESDKLMYCADCALPILIDNIIKEKSLTGELHSVVKINNYKEYSTLGQNWCKQLGLWCSKMIECCNQLLAYNFKKAKQTMKLMVMISQKYEETVSDMLDEKILTEGFYLDFVDYLFQKKIFMENHSSILLAVLKHKKY